jgi:hypothetical protein
MCATQQKGSYGKPPMGLEIKATSFIKEITPASLKSASPNNVTQRFAAQLFSLFQETWKLRPR